MTTSARRWPIRIAIAVAVLAALGSAILFVLMHATAGSHAVVRNATDAPVCDVELDPGVAGRAVTTIARLAPRDTRGVELAVGPLDGGTITVRYRACGSEGAPIESTSVDPARTILLDGEGVRAGPRVRTDEE